MEAIMGRIGSGKEKAREEFVVIPAPEDTYVVVGPAMDGGKPLYAAERVWAFQCRTELYPNGGLPVAAYTRLMPIFGSYPLELSSHSTINIHFIGTKSECDDYIEAEREEEKDRRQKTVACSESCKVGV